MKREPVAVINAIIALIEAAVALWVILDSEFDPKLGAGLMGVVLALGNVVKILWARNQVTPVVDPRDNQGHQLTPNIN